DELLLEPAGRRDGDAGDVGPFDLVEEDVARVLLVDVPADDAELLLVVVRPGFLLLAAARDRRVHELADVVVMERQRLATGRAERLAGAGRAGHRGALHDEAGV